MICSFLDVNQKTIQFLKEKVSMYYSNADLELPPRFGKREWGFFHYGGKGMQRPVTFTKKEELARFLSEKAPAHAYFSSAYYQDPSVPMTAKDWLGADLVFDLDADHIHGAEKMTYAEMLSAVKVEFIKLIDDFLLQDFGFREEDVTIVFSGGRGYHAHIRAPKVLSLDRYQRMQIVDYITGKDLDVQSLFPKEVVAVKGSGIFQKPVYNLSLPSRDSKGWKGKIRRGIMDLLENLSTMEMDEAVKYLRSFQGVGPGGASEIYETLFPNETDDSMVKRMDSDDMLDIFPNKRILNQFLNIVKEEVAGKLAGETDEPVTADVKRLIRMPTSLHGKTLLRVTPLEIPKLEDFNPLEDAIAFSSEPVNIKLVKPLDVIIGGKEFILEKGRAELPLYAAMFALGGKFAEME